MNQQELWDDVVGDGWVRYAPELDQRTAAFGVAAMDALEPLAGAAVLDVGCGSGETTRRLAARVGSAGRVTGVDLSTRMLEHARAESGEISEVSFVLGDASTVTLDHELDVVYSQMGVMFFEDPVAAFAHLRSLVRPDGRLGFACWADPFSNPWMLVPVLASASVLGPPELPGPGEPGPFSLGDADILTTTLRAAGWADVGIETMNTNEPWPTGDARATAAMMIETNPVLASGLRRLPDRRADLVDALVAALAEHEHDGAVVFQAKASIVTATAGR